MEIETVILFYFSMGSISPVLLLSSVFHDDVTHQRTSGSLLAPRLPDAGSHIRSAVSSK